MQHMVVISVPRCATKYVQKWDTSMTHLRSNFLHELRVGSDQLWKWYQIQRTFAHFDTCRELTTNHAQMAPYFKVAMRIMGTYLTTNYAQLV